MLFWKQHKTLAIFTRSVPLLIVALFLTLQKTRSMA